HDALARIADVEQGDAGARAFLAEGADEIGARRHDGFVSAARESVDDVVHDAEHALNTAHAAPAIAQAAQRHSARALVQENAVDGEQSDITQRFHAVLRPD